MELGEKKLLGDGTFFVAEAVLARYREEIASPLLTLRRTLP